MHNGPLGAHGNQVLGLAGGEVGTKFTAAFETKNYRDGLICLNVKEIKATFFAHPKVHIASNFKRGTCEYVNVLKHEEKHVRVLKKTHKEFMPKYKKHLRVTAKKLPILEPMSLKDANSKKQIFVTHIQKDLSAYMQKIMQEVEIRQKEVDSAEEYERVLNQCRKWDQRLAEEPK